MTEEPKGAKILYAGCMCIVFAIFILFNLTIGTWRWVWDFYEIAKAWWPF